MTKTLTAPPIVANTRRLADSRASRLASLARPRLARTPRLMSRLAHAPRNRCRTAPRSAHIAARAAARGRRASNPATHLHRLAPRSLRLDPPITPRSSPSAPESHRLRLTTSTRIQYVVGRGAGQNAGAAVTHLWMDDVHSRPMSLSRRGGAEEKTSLCPSSCATCPRSAHALPPLCPRFYASPGRDHRRLTCEGTCDPPQ